MTTVAEVATLAATLRAERHWREGQAAFNALYQLVPEAADAVRNMPVDPFYEDWRLPAFWTFLGDWLGDPS